LIVNIGIHLLGQRTKRDPTLLEVSDGGEKVRQMSLGR